MSVVETPSDHAVPGAAVLRDFVGRARPLTELRAALADATEGRGRAILIRGEAGIGKSRLAEELVREAAGRGCQVLWGRCWEGGGAPAYWPWVQIVRAHARAASNQVRAPLSKDVITLVHAAPESDDCKRGIPGEQATGAANTRGTLFASVIALLRSTAQAAPLVVVVDDLHAADADSVLLLWRAARELRDARVLLLGSYRDAAGHGREDLTQLLGQIERECSSIQLSGLTGAEVAELLRRIAGEEETDDAAVDATVAAVQALTAGNPFFVQEVVRILAAERAFEKLELGTRRLKLPAHVHDAVRRRLRSISTEMRDVLRIGAALGREFDRNVVQRVIDAAGNSIAVGPLLELASCTAVLTRVDRDRYAFVHSLIAEALYNELLDSERADLHRRIGAVLEDVYRGGADDHSAELAYHFVHGAVRGDIDKAIDYATRAGDRAAAVCAYDEAVEQYRTALEVFDLKTDIAPAEQSRRCELLLTLERLQVSTGAREDALATAARAAAAAREIGSAELLAKAAIALPPRGIVAGRQGEPVLELLKDAAAALSTASPEHDGLYAAVLGSLALVQRGATVEVRDELASNAVRIARAAAAPALLARSLLDRREAVQDPIFEERQLADTTEAIELARVVGNLQLEVRARLLRFVNLMNLGRTREAEHELETNTRLAEELREPEFLQQTIIQRTMWALFVGQLAAAEQSLWRAFELAQCLQHEEVGSRVVASVSGDGSKQSTDFISQLFLIRREQGRSAEFSDGLKALADELDNIPVFQAAYSLVQADNGLEAEARRAFEGLATAGFKSIPRDGSWLAAICMLAETCAFLCDRDRGRYLYDWLQPYGRRNMVVGFTGYNSTGSVSRNLGLLAALLGNWEDAVAHFELALRENERMGTRPWVAYTQCDYARLLLARGGRGPARCAQNLLDAAIMTARELSYTLLEERATRLRAAVS